MTAERGPAIGELGFVGAGRISRATARGLVNAGFPAERVRATSRTNAGARQLAQEIGTHVDESVSEVARRADVVVLAVEPAQAPEVVAELAGHLRAEQLLVSFVGSYRLSTVERAVPAVPVVRAVPAVTLAAEAGVLAVAAGEHVAERQWRVLHDVFGPIGRIVRVEDEAMELASAVAGAGPAVFGRLGQQLAAEAVARGLDEGTARVLVEQTLRGTGALLRSGMPLSEVVDNVASPGGMTAGSLRALAERDSTGTLGEAVEAALEVSRARLA